MKILGIIPARYESSRFPGKPLIDIKGKSMIQRVYEQAIQSSYLTDVIVATDDIRIFNAVNKFDGKVMMTSSSHESGTDRCAEIIAKSEKKYDIAINIQGDEPYIDPIQINQLCACFEDDNTEIATLMKEITSEDDINNPNRPKVTFDENWFAKKFSRKTIGNEVIIDGLLQIKYYKHIGIYGYKTNVLGVIGKLKQTPLEIEERLEQMRWVENNYKIKVAITNIEASAIDTRQDLEDLLNKI